MNLPEQFCWTRFGAEAGQTIEQILERKEQERLANDGIFFWGIGNGVGPSMLELLRRCKRPEVLFSPIKSPARVEDVAPKSVAAWTSGLTLAGERFTLPSHALVTSRFNEANPRSFHYALVCSADKPLRLTTSKQRVDTGEIRNILTNNRVGASQVTSIVRRMHEGDRERSYEVALRVRLAPPYFVRLQAPVLLPNSLSREVCLGGTWVEVIHEVERLLQERSDAQLTLPGMLTDTSYKRDAAKRL